MTGINVISTNHSLFNGVRIMSNYYVVSNTIGSTIDVDGTDLVCGESYPNKTKAGKDADYVLAYHKDPDISGNWIFDGQAILDKTEFYPDVTEVCRELAWKSAKIDIQAKIRPSKDSKKAVRAAEMATDIADLEKRFADGDIDGAEFGKLAIEITRKYQ